MPSTTASAGHAPLDSIQKPNQVGFPQAKLTAQLDLSIEPRRLGLVQFLPKYRVNP